MEDLNGLSEQEIEELLDELPDVEISAEVSLGDQDEDNVKLDIVIPGIMLL